VVKGDRAAYSIIDAVIEVKHAELGGFIVIFDNKAGLGRVSQAIEVCAKPLDCRRLVAICAADMDVDWCGIAFRQLHEIHDACVLVQIIYRLVDYTLSRRSKHIELAWVKGDAQVVLVHELADLLHDPY
jgi:hypothetical protein